MHSNFEKKLPTMDLTTIISNELVTKLDLPNFKAGDNVTVYYKIKEGEKERIQFFKGDVIQEKIEI